MHVLCDVVNVRAQIKTHSQWKSALLFEMGIKSASSTSPRSRDQQLDTIERIHSQTSTKISNDTWTVYASSHTLFMVTTWTLVRCNLMLQKRDR